MLGQLLAIIHLWIGLKRKVIAKGTWVGVRWRESGRKKMGGSDHKKKLGL